ncbi:hypothetical protein [Natronosalvus amylolyticus]|uniref:hypothetical protein n=1 Tax=Natronosalvus amylolyticus TaxID=2961994 RepID=UPI0020C9AD82|nr:hypothetical protein [Natronosalvus amylolyticus]
MVELKIADDVTVVVESGEKKSYSYTVLSGGQEVISYETSADVRKPAGKVGLRNVIYRQVSGLDKQAIEIALDTAVGKHKTAIEQLE